MNWRDFSRNEYLPLVPAPHSMAIPYSLMSSTDHSPHGSAALLKMLEIHNYAWLGWRVFRGSYRRTEPQITAKRDDDDGDDSFHFHSIAVIICKCAMVWRTQRRESGSDRARENEYRKASKERSKLMLCCVDNFMICKYCIIIYIIAGFHIIFWRDDQETFNSPKC